MHRSSKPRRSGWALWACVSQYQSTDRGRASLQYTKSLADLVRQWCIQQPAKQCLQAGKQNITPEHVAAEVWHHVCNTCAISEMHWPHENAEPQISYWLACNQWRHQIRSNYKVDLQGSALSICSTWNWRSSGFIITFYRYCGKLHTLLKSFGYHKQDSWKALLSFP